MGRKTGELAEAVKDATGRDLIKEREDLVIANLDRKSTRLNSSHSDRSRMPSSA